MPPKIYQINAVIGANSYLIESDGGLIVVDTGLPLNADRIISFIKSKGRKPNDLKYIILTHADIDHAGSAGDLRAKTGAKVAIHWKEFGILAGDKPARKMNGAVETVAKPALRLVKMDPVRADIWLWHGRNFGQFKVLKAPGHSPGSICLYDKADSILFSGDALLCDIVGNIIGPIAVFATRHKKAKRTAKKLKALNFKALYPGHGKPWISGRGFI